MKRYAIVRVDGNHKPSHFEVERVENIADLKLLDNVVKTYGDTKEQIVRKIAQVIERKLKGGLILRNTKINETYNIQKAISAKAVAKEIVEFLGVE